MDLEYELSWEPAARKYNDNYLQDLPNECVCKSIKSICSYELLYA